jgi:hypothetical protein
MRDAAGIGLGTTIKYLRCTASGAAGNGLGTMVKYLRRTASAAAYNCLGTTITPPCSVAAFVVNSELHTGARPSARLCVRPELACGVHEYQIGASAHSNFRSRPRRRVTILVVPAIPRGIFVLITALLEHISNKTALGLNF